MMRPLALLMCADADPMLNNDPGAWRIDKKRLEARWGADVRQRQPRFLGFHHARNWARANWHTTEDDWREWIEDGEKRNVYIPSHPDEVYADKGWISWVDFLNGPIE